MLLVKKCLCVIECDGCGTDLHHQFDFYAKDNYAEVLSLNQEQFDHHADVALCKDCAADWRAINLD